MVSLLDRALVSGYFSDYHSAYILFVQRSDALLFHSDMATVGEGGIIQNVITVSVKVALIQKGLNYKGTFL